MASIFSLRQEAQMQSLLGVAEVRVCSTREAAGHGEGQLGQDQNQLCAAARRTLLSPTSLENRARTTLHFIRSPRA